MQCSPARDARAGAQFDAKHLCRATIQTPTTQHPQSQSKDHLGHQPTYQCSLYCTITLLISIEYTLLRPRYYGGRRRTPVFPTIPHQGLQEFAPHFEIFIYTPNVGFRKSLFGSLIPTSHPVLNIEIKGPKRGLLGINGFPTQDLRYEANSCKPQWSIAALSRFSRPLDAI